MEAQWNPDLRVLLDENISPNIVPPLWEARVDAVSIRDRGMLRSADNRVLAFAEREGRAVATIDEFDFRDLIAKKKTHHGVWVIPSGGTRQDQLAYLMAIAKYARTHGKSDPMLLCMDRVIAVSEDFQISSAIVRAPAPVVRAIAPRPA